jgi:hypothetical protein
MTKSCGNLIHRRTNTDAKSLKKNPFAVAWGREVFVMN